MIKVLIVDDEMLVRKGIVLEVDWNAINCIVVGEAANGIDGIEAYQKYKPDLIISDIRMPKKDGIEMVKELRSQGSDVEVIFLTAYSDFSYAQNAVKVLAADYILKPFSDGELEQAVVNVQVRIEEKRKKVSSASKETQLSLPKGDKSKYVMEAMDYIANHYMVSELSIREIAEYIGVSEGHLSHIFKKETDYSIMSYITRYRIQIGRAHV